MHAPTAINAFLQTFPLLQKPIAHGLFSSGEELRETTAGGFKALTKIAEFNDGLRILGPDQRRGKAMSEQAELNLRHFPFQEYLGNFKRVRRAPAKAHGVTNTWKQLSLKLYVRALVKKASAFIWTRPDGKQFFCKTLRQLVARIMDYDGFLLKGVLRSAHR